MRKIIMTKAALVLTAAAAAATALTAAPASAATASRPYGNVDDSGNWAGYYAVPKTGSPKQVSASWTVPKVNCRHSRGYQPYVGSMWVGIGGDNTGKHPDTGPHGRSAWLEQTGIEIQCRSLTAKPRFNPFWEIVRPGSGLYDNPYDSVIFKDTSGHEATVSPGDKIQTFVFDISSTGARKFSFLIYVTHSDGTESEYAKQAFLPKTAYTGVTAEVITEWATIPADSGHGRQGGLADMGNVRYTYAWMGTGLPGNPNQGIVPVTQYKFTLVYNHHGKQMVVTRPGSAQSDESPGFKDSFTTYYNWLSDPWLS